MTGSAFDLAARGVARSPLNAEALELAERSARGEADLAALSALYDLVAGRALGRFGRRAAHYRGARFFERSAENALALKHAAQAFYAVPSEGSGFHLLARAGGARRRPQRMRCERSSESPRTLPTPTFAPHGFCGRRPLRATASREPSARPERPAARRVTISPSPAVVERVRDATRELMGFGPAEDDRGEARIHAAMRAIGERLLGSGRCARRDRVREGAPRAVRRPGGGALVRRASVRLRRRRRRVRRVLPWGPALAPDESTRASASPRS